MLAAVEGSTTEIRTFECTNPFLYDVAVVG
jgi:hypothetical protein